MSLEKLLSPSEAERIGVSSMNQGQRQALYEWGLRMFQLGQHPFGEVGQIKYDGKLVILSDGSRWEVDSLDTSVADLWSEMDKVVVIDGLMYNLEQAEHIAVQEEV
jgi:hypothetical protein